MKSWLLFLLGVHAAAGAEPATVLVGDFSHGRLDQWESKAFKGRTEYRLVKLDGKTVLHAESDAAASGLFKEQRIDLQQTPYLYWSWRIAKRLGKLDEQSKSGDDYAARIYLAISGGVLFWRTRAINYVWASNTEKGKIWPNAFAGDHVMMVAVRSAADRLDTWQNEKRNVRVDLQQLFGEDIRFIDAVALMTDTDNAAGDASADYGDIYFSAQ
ncbi:MAG: DUF3047 domain-containing protein [Gammaproteobacteria bacterium]